MTILFQWNSEAAKSRKELEVLQLKGIQQHSADSNSSFSTGDHGKQMGTFQGPFSHPQGAGLIKSHGGDTILVGMKQMEQEIMGKEMGHHPPQTTITSISVEIKRSRGPCS